MRVIALLALVGSCSFFIAPALAQTDANDLAQGRELLGRLSRNPASPAADGAIFQQVGVEVAQKLLLAVATHGMQPGATIEEWAEMHRAYDALIEVCADQQQLLRASVFANLQDFAYRNNEGDYTEALAAARRALDLQQRSGQLQTISIPWENLGVDLIHLGRIDEGANALYQARKFLQDPTSSLAGDIRTRIIAIESSRDNPIAARRESEDFLHSAGANTPATFRASALLAAANLDIDDHRYDEAVVRVHDALHTVKGAPDAMSSGYQALNVLLTIGLAAMENLPYDQALSLCGKLDQEFPGLPISIAGFSRQIGNHRRRLAGQFDLVLRDDAAQLEQARRSNDVTGQVASLLSTAVDYAYLRATTQQVTALEQAADLLHSPAGASVPANLRFRVLDRLGDAQLENGDMRAARAAYTEVLSGIEATASAQSQQQLATIYADAQLGMATLLERDGEGTEARKILDQALNPPTGALGRFTRSAVLLQSARLEESAQSTSAERQQPDEVARIYLEAIAELHKEEDANTEVYARLKLVHYLATIGADKAGAGATSARREAQAVAMAREQLAIARSAASSVDLADASWRVRFLEGILDQDEGKRDDAIRDYAEAVNALDRIRTGLSMEEERKSFIDSDAVQELYRRQVQLLTANGRKEEAWQYLERDKARTFLESMRGRHFTGLSPESEQAGSGAELQQLEQKIMTTRLSLSAENESTLRQSGRTPEGLQVKLIALENQFALARQQKMLNQARATQPMALAPIGLSATQNRLPARTALIEYAVLDGEIAAFVVTRNSAKELRWPANTARLPAMLRRLSDQLSSAPVEESNLDAELDSASQVLLAPVLGALAPQIDKLIIVPTQSLALVPFHALPLPRQVSSGAHGAEKKTVAPGSAADPASRPLVIDRYAVAYLPSASTLQFLHFGPSSASTDLFLGAIGNVSSENRPALPGTLAETAAIQRLYPAAVRVTGAEFTHDAAVKALLEHQEVHFATHGRFEQQSPFFSALITAPAEGQPTKLALYELTNMEVRARLVILSACETDRGPITRGDEGVGLTRTFLQAGAESVVSSLWKVSDESTALLMESLHAHLRLGELAPDALRHAELEVRQKFPQPFYWAAFVATGVR
ncbi:MAG TPA: CHAT domain-containing protein [Terracidiphilus sp.]|jgi:CHAT domain-containing protein|nr:CHAT domain-containing protein [Terracidiphilus sp.]